MWMGRAPLFGLLAVVLVVTSCRLELGKGSSSVAGSGAGGDWLALSSSDDLLSISVPTDWKVVEQPDGAISLKAAASCTLEVVLVADGKRADLSQADVLALMLDKAVAESSQEGREIEIVGKRVWLGQHYIWHEVHYVVSGQARTDYYIDSIAYPSSSKTLEARSRCPGEAPPSDEQSQLLQSIMDTVEAHTSGEA